jgi:DNA-binding response OmpR family regulator
MHSVLLVEDDDAVRATFRRILTETGFSVVAVATAAEALRHVATVPLDLVLLDLGLPDLDGTDALRMIRGICSVPVIVTARREDNSFVHLLNADADDFLVKPFSGEHLVTRMQVLLRRTAARDAADDRSITVGALRIDPAQRTASLHGEWLELTPAGSSTCSSTSPSAPTGW